MLVTILATAAGVVLAFIVAGIVSAVVRSLAHRSPISSDLTARSRRPLRLVLVVVGVWVALNATTDSPSWMTPTAHLLRIALIIGVAWLVGTLLFVIEDAALLRYRLDVPDNRHARRIRTQVSVLRRLTVAIVVVGAIAAVLLTFPALEKFGGGLLASAGLLSIVAGLAAQSSLANLFAGLQLAFTDAIRVDDVVVVRNEWGRIEEVTLTYVVVHVWDDRRLILPSVYFTTTPFENWTRRAADLLGTVELDVDWAVPVVEMRAELTRLLAASDLWDRRVGILQVTEATGGRVRVRALASAADAPTLFDLRCYIREGLVAWVQRSAPQALPRTRLENVASTDDAATAPEQTAYDRVAARTDLATRRAARLRGDDAQHGDTQRFEIGPQDARLFTGSIDAMERSRAFSGPGDDVIAEREHAAGAADARPARATGPVTVVGPPLTPEPAARRTDGAPQVAAPTGVATPTRAATPAREATPAGAPTPTRAATPVRGAEPVRDATSGRSAAPVWGTAPAADAAPVWGIAPAPDAAPVWGTPPGPDGTRVWGTEPTVGAPPVRGSGSASTSASDARDLFGVEATAVLGPVEPRDSSLDETEVLGRARSRERRRSADPDADPRYDWRS